MHDPADVLDAFEATLRNQVAFVLQTAGGSPPGGGPGWDGVLARFEIAGARPDRRGALAASRGLSRGAFPEEVEQVLLALSHRAWQTLHSMHAWGVTDGRVDLQTRWLGREHAKDTEAYRHASVDERLEWVKAGIREGQLSGFKADIYFELSRKERANERRKILRKQFCSACTTGLRRPLGRDCAGQYRQLHA